MNKLYSYITSVKTLGSFLHLRMQLENKEFSIVYFLLLVRNSIDFMHRKKKLVLGKTFVFCVHIRFAASSLFSPRNKILRLLDRTCFDFSFPTSASLPPACVMFSILTRGSSLAAANDEGRLGGPWVNCGYLYLVFSVCFQVFR